MDAVPGGAISTPPPAVDRVCEVCGSADHVPLRRYTVSQWPVVQCSACGFVFLVQVPAYELLVDEYAWEKSHKKEAARRKRRFLSKFDHATRFRLAIGKSGERRLMRSALGSSGRILDIGCGPGPRVPEGFTPYGIEISKGLAQQAEPAFAARGGRVVHAPALEGLDAFPDNWFRAVLMRSYLEHESQPRKVLMKTYRKLADGGIVFVKVPDYNSLNRHIMGANWCGFRFPDHVNYFTGATLKRLASQIGFKYVRRNIPGLDDNLYATLTKTS
jgi:SAM-dependent methyltransferase